MAGIAPFRALRYDAAKLGGDTALSQVLAPPYDVLPPEDAAARRAAHAASIVRVTLPDGEGDARFAGAADCLARWRADGTLARDERPALYYYTQLCEGHERRGFFCRVRLAPYEKREVLPHERTHAGPKAERLMLYRACRVQPEPLFFLYRDAGSGLLDRLEAAARGDASGGAVPPLGRAVCGGGHGGPERIDEALWRVQDPAAIAVAVRALASRALYIADGHHRYETSLAYEAELDAAGAPADGAHHYVLAFLTAAEDRGLVIHPTHRTLRRVGLSPAVLRAAVRARLRSDALPDGATAGDLERRLGAAPGGAVVAAYPDGSADLVHFPAAPGAAPATAGLDVTRFNDDLLLGALGIGGEGKPVAEHVFYVQGAAAAVARARDGKAEAAFLLKPTPASAVLAVADEGGVMPQKSTFFYPKVTTGWVLNPVDPAERVEA
ncbi:MAG TPA: DUF1015 domain-containing protein [Myxococcota bacterium]|jgi:uncharacterized protein (DUF1015 family)|nr:DUF1015 domain-containing protein [Myxococcota bacterium]